MGAVWVQKLALLSVPMHDWRDPQRLHVTKSADIFQLPPFSPVYWLKNCVERRAQTLSLGSICKHCDFVHIKQISVGEVYVCGFLVCVCCTLLAVSGSSVAEIMLRLHHTPKSPLSWMKGIWSIAPDRQTWARCIRLGWALCISISPAWHRVCGTDPHVGWQGHCSPLPGTDICSCFLWLEVATDPSVLGCQDFCSSHSATKSALETAFCKLCDTIFQCWHKLLWLKDLSGQNHLNVFHITLQHRKIGPYDKNFARNPAGVTNSEFND